MAKGYFFAKVVLRHEDEKMSNDFENSQEYRKAHEITKKQEELYKNVVGTLLIFNSVANSDSSSIFMA